MLAQGLAWALLMFCITAHAEVDCPGIYGVSAEQSKNTFYVLTFLGGAAGISGVEAKLREAKRGQLESTVSPKLQDYVLKLARRISESGPTIALIACDRPMGAADLDRNDLEDLSRRNVFAVLWGGSEGDRASVVYVSLPHYQRRMGNRRQVEVAWLRAAVSADSLDDWVRELGRDSIAQQALLALGIGFVAIKQSDWRLAKLSLCQVRSNLKLMAQETVRPAPADLEEDILRLVNEAIAQIDEGARVKGLDLNAITPIKLACSA